MMPSQPADCRFAGRSRRRAFTLVELLVAIAIVGVLAALLLPAVNGAREVTRRAMCSSNLRQLATAATAFESSKGTYPPGLQQFESRRSPTYRGTSLFVFLLPYMDQSAIADRWNYEAPLANTEGGSEAVCAVVLPALVCPSSDIADNPSRRGRMWFGMTSYGGNGGRRSFDPDEATLDGMFHTTGPASLPEPGQWPVGSHEVTDGTAETLFFGERSHRDGKFETFAARRWANSLRSVGSWAAVGGRRRIGDVTLSSFAPLNYRLPFDIQHVDQAERTIKRSSDFGHYEDLRVCAYGSEHLGGSNFAMVDSSVRFVSDLIEHGVLKQLSTRNGRESVTRQW